MPAMTTSAWTLTDIPWSHLDRSKVSPELLALVKTAAMVERNGADYGRYLANVFADDPEFCAAARRWAVEEEQHGLALGRWAELVDPAFKLEERFAQFTAMYRIPVESDQSVRGSRSAELCARCVVETGTSSLYSALRDGIDEPALKAICKNIAADEFRHYKLFFTHMERMLALEGIAKTWRSRLSRIKTALGRFRETDDDEIASAYHAGNALPEPYDRAASTAVYSATMLSFYRERHIRRVGHMFAQAAGIEPEGWLARALTRAVWWIISWRARTARSSRIGHVPAGT